MRVVFQSGSEETRRAEAQDSYMGNEAKQQVGQVSGKPSRKVSIDSQPELPESRNQAVLVILLLFPIKGLMSNERRW